MVVAEEARLGALLEPGVGALVLEGLADAGVDRRVVQDLGRAVGLALHEQVSGTPQARWRLISQSGRASTIERMRLRPVCGVPADELVDRGERRSRMVCAVGVHAVVERLVHGDEPLRRVAVDHRRLGAPGVRIAVLQPAAGEQGAGLDQLVDHRGVGLALLALGLEHLQAARRGGRAGRRTASSSDVVGHPVDEAVLDEQLVVVGAVAGAVWTKPVPASSVTWSPASIGTRKSQ